MIWFRDLLKKYCDVQITNFLKILLLETSEMTQKVKNSCVSLVSTYIICMWNVRDNNLDKDSVIKYIKGEIINKHRYLEYAMEEKFLHMVTQQYCAMDSLDI